MDNVDYDHNGARPYGFGYKKTSRNFNSRFTRTSEQVVEPQQMKFRFPQQKSHPRYMSRVPEKCLYDWWRIVEIEEGVYTKKGDPALYLVLKSEVSSFMTKITMNLTLDFVQKELSVIQDANGGTLVGAKVWLTLVNGFNVLKRVKSLAGKDIFL